MIYVTGDTHIPYDIHKLSTRVFVEQKSLTKDDYIIICGDFGLIFNYRETGISVPSCLDDLCWNKEELFWFDWLNSKNYTTLWVDGNHENHDRLKKYPVSEWHGGKVQRISDSIIHLIRGQIYDINGHSFFTLGGAQSHDRGTVTGTEKKDIHKWWWREEMPSEEEYEEALRNLAIHNNKVDYVITHEAPGNIAKMLNYEQNELTYKLQDIYENVDFDLWYCGHHHVDRRINDVRLLYNDVVALENIKCTNSWKISHCITKSTMR